MDLSGGARREGLAQPTQGARAVTRRVILAAVLAGASPAAFAAADAADDEQNLNTAERFIDAFYSFDRERLGAIVKSAGESGQRILYYQGWAEGAHYKVLNRAPCAPESAQTIACPITVQDDPVLALKTGFNVTDTFHLTFDGTSLVTIDTSSNDQPVYHQARDWVKRQMPEVMTGPCKGFFEGGSTPGDCARAMTEGYRRFAESDEYPL